MTDKPANANTAAAAAAARSTVAALSLGAADIPEQQVVTNENDNESQKKKKKNAAVTTSTTTTTTSIPRNTSAVSSEAGGASTSAGGGYCSSDGDHALSLVHRLNNTSEVESLAKRIEQRRANRIPVTWAVRNRLLMECRRIAPTRIAFEQLLEYRNRVQREVDAQSDNILTRTWEWLGFRNTPKVLLHVLNCAVIRVQDELKHEYFYYQDYSFYFTTIESKWPFMRNAFYVSLWMLVLFYLGTAVLFCTIMDDPGVCPRNEHPDKPYAGWLTAIYFASTTMSTVGYGDVSVMGGSDNPEKWRIFIGACYMICALLVVILAFSSVVDQTTSPLANIRWVQKLTDWLYGSPEIKPGQLLKHKIRRVGYAKLGAICFQFLALNLVGMFVNRAFVKPGTPGLDEAEQWSWMETFYWSIQTTTTIGYGDMVMPFEFRWFQVFYLLISTYFVGDALGKIGSFYTDVSNLRRFFAWNRREVSQGMIEDWQAEDHDDKIDQYEFAIASLLDLGRISHDDLQPIMTKFRGLAGPKGFISLHDDFHEDGTRVEASNNNPEEGGAGGVGGGMTEEEAATAAAAVAVGATPEDAKDAVQGEEISEHT